MLIRNFLPITSGIHLRSPIPDDVEPLCAIEFDDDVKRFSKKPNRTLDDWKREFRSQLQDTKAITVVTLPELVVAGRASLSRGSHHVDGRHCLEPPYTYDLEIFIGRAYWGRGIGIGVAKALIPVAFGPLQASAVTGTINPANDAAKRMLLGLGFEHYGVKAGTWGDGWQAGHHIYLLKARA